MSDGYSWLNGRVDAFSTSSTELGLESTDSSFFLHFHSLFEISKA